MHTPPSTLPPPTPLQTLLATIRATAHSQTDTGAAFETLCLRYLQAEPKYRSLYAKVQPYRDWAAQYGASLGVTPNDKGIDLVATTHSGEYHAVQCKCYASDHIVSKADIDSFIAASGHQAFSRRMLIDTTHKPLGGNAEEMLARQHVPVTRIGLLDLEASNIDWSRYPVTTPHTATPSRAAEPDLRNVYGVTPHDNPLALKPKHAPRPYQQTAIDDVLAGLQVHDRGKLIMACGTGKTFTALQISERQAGAGQTVLFLVPSLALLSQTLTEWSQQSQTPITAFAVCSDTEVGKQRHTKDDDDDAIHMALHELAYPATTDAAKLVREYADRHTSDAMTVVFSTYHSIDVLREAQQTHGLPAFDLAVCDEAHRTTGIQFDGDDESAFVRIHDNTIIQAKKRLYMTATPRIYRADDGKKKHTSQKTANLFTSAAPEAADTLQQLNTSTLYSMDDEALYGKDLHVLSFSEAVKKDLLAPYKVIVLTVDEQDVGERLQDLLNDGNNNLQVGDAARIVGCYKALAKVGEDWGEDGKHPGDNGGAMNEPRRAIMQKAVAFCQIIGQDRKGQLINPGKKIAARQIAEQFNLVTREYQKNPQEGEPTGIEFEARFIHGGMHASEKSERLHWLKAPTAPNHCRVLTNVRCLSEGVDVPALDAAIFLSPRQSQVDVVQSVGRVMRKAPGKARGYIILPVVIPWGMTPAEAMRDNKPWQVVWKTLAALKAHDDEGFGRMINRAELVGNDPDHFQIFIDPATIRRVKAKTDEQQQQSALNQTRTSHNLGNATEGSENPAGASSQFEMDLTTGALEQAIRAKVVKKMADPDYWDRWSGGIARIAQMQIDRITSIVQNPDSPTKQLARHAFDAFAAQLRKHLNPSVADADIIEMIAQHLITGPVFDALFANARFSKNNPISADLQTIADILLKDFHLDKEHQQLQGFYEQVRKQAEDIHDPTARQKLLIRLYDNFFASAFPRVVQKHGIVYTPVEIVDFILHSVAHILQTQFNKTLADEDVQVLDPFTGTGTFIARLLTSGLIDTEKLPQVYAKQLHATEILLLPYYIAAVNIESTFAGQFPELPYTPFPGILLADTFNIPTTKSEDWVENQAQEALAANNARRKRQMDSKITVIVGNPPYSVGQRSENDNNANVRYEELDKRIETTYAKQSRAVLKKGLYDSYIRAIRWASDRINKDTGGILGFVTNAGWLDSSATAGLRQCLKQEFSSLYVFHLRGNQRTQGEQSRKEGGKIFGSGSRAPIAISILVKTPQHNTKTGNIYFYDIGDYLSREQKLQKISELASIHGIEQTQLWQPITPDAHGDWLNQRQTDFSALLPIGDTKNKNKPGNTGIFKNFSLGISTNRDAWCNNPSRPALLGNIRRLVDFYETQRAAFKKDFPDTKQRQTHIADFIDTDPIKISWTHNLKGDLARDKALKFNSNTAVPTLYRPFNKGWLYYDRRLNERVHQMPQLFPLPAGIRNQESGIRNQESGIRNQESIIPSESLELFPNSQKNQTTDEQKNRMICVSGIGSRGFSVLMADLIPSLDCIEKGQCFPRYLYDETGKQKDGITDATLTVFQNHYQNNTITKDQLFHYIYGILHSPHYREIYAHNLTKELPHIPFAASFDDFCKFANTGKQLGDLHCNFETVPEYVGVDIHIHKKGCTTINDLLPADFAVEKMKYGKIATNKDLTTIVYNAHITVRGIPIAAYDYVVNGRPAIDWVVERQCIKTDKTSGIVSDANRYAIETLNNPRYPLELLLRVITISLETLGIVRNLPKLDR